MVRSAFWSYIALAAALAAIACLSVSFLVLAGLGELAEVITGINWTQLVPDLITAATIGFIIAAVDARSRRKQREDAVRLEWAAARARLHLILETRPMYRYWDSAETMGELPKDVRELAMALPLHQWQAIENSETMRRLTQVGELADILVNVAKDFDTKLNNVIRAGTLPLTPGVPAERVGAAVRAPTMDEPDSVLIEYFRISPSEYEALKRDREIVLGNKNVASAAEAYRFTRRRFEELVVELRTLVAEEVLDRGGRHTR